MWSRGKMAFSTQLGLLLWKNFTFRRRQTVSSYQMYRDFNASLTTNQMQQSKCISYAKRMPFVAYGVPRLPFFCMVTSVRFWRSPTPVLKGLNKYINKKTICGFVYKHFKHKLTAHTCTWHSMYEQEVQMPCQQEAQHPSL